MPIVALFIAFLSPFLSVWRPPLELSDVREGQVFTVLGLEPRAARGEAAARAVMELQSSRGTTWTPLEAPAPNTSPLRVHARPRLPWTLAQAPHAGLPSSDVDLEEAVVLRVGPAPDRGSPGPAAQWLFLADPSCAAGPPGVGADPRPWLLAVRLEGPARGMDWMDPGEHEGAVLQLRDLLLGHVDLHCRVQQAVADRHSSVRVVR